MTVSPTASQTPLARTHLQRPKIDQCALTNVIILYTHRDSQKSNVSRNSINNSSSNIKNSNNNNKQQQHQQQQQQQQHQQPSRRNTAAKYCIRAEAAADLAEQHGLS